jgi:hypothetical protein
MKYFLIDIIAIMFPHPSVAVFFMFGFSASLRALRTSEFLFVLYGIASFIGGIFIAIGLNLEWRSRDHQIYILFLVVMSFFGFILLAGYLLNGYLSKEKWLYLRNSKLLVYALRFGWCFCFMSALLVLYLQHFHL